MDEEEFDTGLSWLRQDHFYLLFSEKNVIGNHESKKVYITECGHKILPHLLLNMVLLTSEEKNAVS